MEPHGFVDLSRRKPYLCGLCRLDILDPIHQPTLDGIVIEPTTTPQGHTDDAPIEVDQRQLAMF